MIMLRVLTQTEDFKFPKTEKLNWLSTNIIVKAVRVDSFDSSTKGDLNTFTLSSGSELSMRGTIINGGSHAIYIPDNTANASFHFERGYVYSTRGSAKSSSVLF